MLHARALSGIVQVDDNEFEWELRREPQWCTADGWQGMAIALRQKGAQREAILQFPMPAARRSKLQPQLRRPQVNHRIIENGVRAALSAGWLPSTRGKAVLVEVDAEGN